MPTQVSLLDGALASAGTLAIQTNGTTNAITISSAQVATFVNNPIMTGLTASRAVFTDGSKGLTSNAITGTGNVVMSASPTLTGTISGAAITLSSDLTLSGGTANGVAYLNGSKVLTTGSALWFDGTNFGVGTGGNALNHQSVIYKVGANAVYQQVANGSTGLGATNGVRLGVSAAGLGELYSPTALISYIDNTEQMRLTSTGLGIGTSSPAAQLHLQKSSGNATAYIESTATNGYSLLQIKNTGTSGRTFEIGTGGSSAIAPYAGSLYISDNTAGADRLLLDSSGNIGIGTSSPAFGSGSGLEIERAGIATLRLENSSAGNNLEIYNDSLANGINFRGYNAAPMVFWTNNTERARIDSSGYFLVNTTATVGGASRIGVLFAGNATNGVNIQDSTTTSGSAFIGFSNSSGTTIGSITRNGTTNAVLYNITSDYRLKNNPTPVTGAKEFVMALQPKTWDWWDGSGKGVGFIAHEFMEVAKYSGNGEKDAVDAEGNPVYQSIQPSSSEVMANLVALLQEQQAIIEQLKARLDAANI